MIRNLAPSDGCWVGDLVSRQIYRLDQVERFVLGTVGVPGERQFFIQVKKAGQHFSFALEKNQAQALSERFAEILKDAKLKSNLNAKNEQLDMAPLDSPIDSEFALGVMSISWKYDSKMIDFEAQAITGDSGEDIFDEIVSDDTDNAPPVLRLSLTPQQVHSFVKRANSVIKAGRQPCMFCGGPINPDGHFCPRAN